MTDLHRAALMSALDEALRSSKTQWDAIRVRERELNAMREAVRDADVTAQRLRLALFELDGDHGKSFGDANVANSHRTQQLLREGAL